MSYPTQEDELRAKEGHAEAIKAAEEARFLSIFQTIPTKNVGRLSELAYKITDNFNSVMQEARQESFECVGEAWSDQQRQIGRLIFDRQSEMAERLVSDPMLLDNAAQYEWGRPKGLWRVAPGTDESAQEMTFFRGRREAYRVRFASREGRWMVTDFQPTQRLVE